MKNLFLNLTFLFLYSCNISMAPVNPDQSENGDRDGQDNRDRTVRIDAREKEVFDLINKYRKQNGKAALKWIDQAILEAQYHSEDQAQNGALSHSGLSDRIQTIEARENVDVKSYAENVGYNISAQRMVNGWLSSFGHHRNILGDYTHTGIGKAVSGSQVYFTQIFLKLEH